MDTANHTAHTAPVVLVALALATRVAYTAPVVQLALALAIASGATALSSVPLTGLCGVTLVGRFSPLWPQPRRQSWQAEQVALQQGRWRQTLRRHRNQAGDQQHQHSSRAAASTPSAT